MVVVSTPVRARVRSAIVAGSPTNSTAVVGKDAACSARAGSRVTTTPSRHDHDAAPSAAAATKASAAGPTTTSEDPTCTGRNQLPMSSSPRGTRSGTSGTASPAVVAKSDGPAVDGSSHDVDPFANLLVQPGGGASGPGAGAPGAGGPVGPVGPDGPAAATGRGVRCTSTPSAPARIAWTAGAQVGVLAIDRHRLASSTQSTRGTDSNGATPAANSAAALSSGGSGGSPSLRRSARSRRFWRARRATSAAVTAPKPRAPSVGKGRGGTVASAIGLVVVLRSADGWSRRPFVGGRPPAPVVAPPAVAVRVTGVPAVPPGDVARPDLSAAASTGVEVVGGPGTGGTDAGGVGAAPSNAGRSSTHPG